MTDTFNVFLPLYKVEEQPDGSALVYTRGTREEIDSANEVMDYASTVPEIRKWSEDAFKRSNGMSYGNVRAMHGNIAAGILAAPVAYLDDEKAVDLVIKVIDPIEVKKCKTGVYTGASMGGRYLKRWPDNKQPGVMRYTGQPLEWSLVDAPAVSSATFTMVKLDGSTELRKLGAPVIDPLTPADLNPASEERGANAVDQTPPDTLPVNASGEQVHPIQPIGDHFLPPGQIDETRGAQTFTPDTPPQPVSVSADMLDVMKAFTAAVSELVAMRKADDGEKAKTEAKLKALGARVGIARREGEPLTPPASYPTEPDQYGDPANYGWPLDTEGRVKSALSSFNGAKGTDVYSPAELAVVGRRIAAKATKQFGTAYRYNAAKKEIAASEAQKMTDKVELSKGALADLLRQLASAMGVGVDQITADPKAALMELMDALDGQTATSTPDMTTSTPVPPMGEQERVSEAVIPDGDMGKVDKLAAQVSELAGLVKALVEQKTAAPEPVQKNTPAGDLAALLNAPPAPVEDDPILKAYLSDAPDGLKKAIELAGGDQNLVYQKARDAALKLGEQTFAKYALAKSFNQGFIPFQPTDAT